MRFKVALALSVSIIFILGASWYRFVGVKGASPDLVVVNNPIDTSSGTLSDTATSTQTASLEAAADTQSESLSETDYVSRQLFSNFFDLANTGQATPNNVDALASSFAQSITGLNQASQVSLTSLDLVPDSAQSMHEYGLAFQSINGKYQSELLTTFGNAGNVGAAGPALVAMAKTLSAIYQSEADELHSLAVPVSLSKDHLALMNAYLSDASAYKALTEKGADPTNMLAAISSASQQGDVENAAIQNIESTLRSNGIIIQSQ